MSAIHTHDAERHWYTGDRREWLGSDVLAGVTAAAPPLVGRFRAAAVIGKLPFVAAPVKIPIPVLMAPDANFAWVILWESPLGCSIARTANATWPNRPTTSRRSG